MIRPLGNRVLLVREKVSEISEGGIVLPDSMLEKPQEARVVALGSEVSSLRVGDIAMIPKYEGAEVDSDSEDDLLMLDAEKILGTKHTKLVMNPIHDNVLVVLKTKDDTTASGIIIPEEAKEEENWGTVIAKGDKSTQVDIMDVVFIRSTSGTQIDRGGKEYVVVNEESILAKIPYIKIGRDANDDKVVAFTGDAPDEGNEGYGLTEEEAIADFKENQLK